MTMSAGFLQSKYRSVPLRDLIVGGEDQARHVMITGPVEPRVNKSTGKTYGSLALQAEGTPNVALISFGDLNRDGSIDYPMTPTVAYSPAIHDYVVRPGDILLRGRGYVGSDKVAVAVYIDREVHDAALSALRKDLPEVHYAFNSSLLRIRLRGDGVNDAPQVEPEYLTAYINSPEAQRYLTKHNQGGLVAGVSKSDILGLPIALPPLSEQKQLIQLIRAQAEYARVSARLSECYGLLANHTFKLS
jgi:hypothetical protein